MSKFSLVRPAILNQHSACITTPTLLDHACLFSVYHQYGQVMPDLLHPCMGCGHAVHVQARPIMCEAQ